ncbi:HAD family hydrolase [Actinomadura sp. BRA 177]|uniref:HAD family hydrolase n=1 Tax=Actinomadura sp. BRA 177 TaxID=2745202 RepID=UPI00159619BF|nr:HAD family hydrolase [Actinomadura sp. BRA 177]NVI89326.1 HAD family hydrolase [Actinomadura sp. BRA 177]
MNSPHQILVTVDVGGTLGTADGPGLTMRLAEVSPLPTRLSREVMRTKLHTRPAITESVVAEVCHALRIASYEFPRNIPPAPFCLFPGTLDALRKISTIATVVTLSNVTCVDADTDGLRSLLYPWVSDYFPSCLIGYTKPDREAFHTVAHRLGRDPRRMIHIGDDWVCDVEGALGAGVKVIWISRGRHAPDESLVRRHGVLIARDLGEAAAHIHDLSTRRIP